MVKEAIETQNKTTLFSKPNSGFNAVMFLTQVPPAHLMSLSLLRSTSVPFAPKLLVWKAFTLCSLTRAVPCQVCEQVDAYGFRPYHQQMAAGHSDEGVPYHYFRGHADQDQV